MQHLDEGTIHAWLDDALPPSEAAAVEAHVAQCAECAGLVAEARGLIAGATRIASSLDHVPVGAIPKQQTPPRSLWQSLRLTPARASIAALLLVGVASMFTARRGELSTTTRESRIARPIAATSAPAVAPAPVAVPETTVVASVAAPARVESGPQRAAASLAKPTAPVPAETLPPPPAADRAASSGLAAAKAAEASAPVDSARIARESAAEQRNAEQRSLAGASAAAAQRVMRQALELSVASPEGCYRVLSDSARSIAIPARFALQRDSVGRNVVLRLSVENRPDSVLSGFAWQQTSPTSTQLTVPTGRLMLMTSGNGRARLEATNGGAEIPLQRTACRP